MFIVKRRTDLEDSTKNQNQKQLRVDRLKRKLGKDFR